MVKNKTTGVGTSKRIRAFALVPGKLAVEATEKISVNMRKEMESAMADDEDSEESGSDDY